MASTDAIINLVVNGSSKLQKAYQTLDQVSATITQLNKTPINIGAADKQIGIVADAYRILLKDAKKFYDEITVGSRKAVGSTKDLYSASKNLASTTAGLRQQAAAFNDLAANIGFADKQQSKYFRSFVQGAELARSKGIRAQMEEFKALSELYTQGVTPFGERFLPGTAPMGRNALQQLIAQGAKVPNTTAALEAYGNELERTIRLVEIGSDAFRALDEAIAENARKLQSAPMQGPQPQVLLGPATDLGSLKAFRQRESYQKRVNDELEKQSAIETRIAQANLFDFQKKELSLQLEEAATALAENRLTDAQRLSRELDRQRQSMERMNRAQKPQVFGALGTGFMPVTGELPSTAGPSGQRIRNLVPGSPAARLEEARAARESTQAAVALARQKQKALEDEAKQLRKGTQAATALGKQKLKALEDEARRLRQETADAVALAQQKMREEEKAIADAWRMRGGPALPPAVEEARQVQRRGGVYRTGEFSPIDAEKRRQAILKANTRLRLKLDEIEASGVNVQIQRATLQDQVNRTISNTFDLNIKNLGVEEDTLAVVSESIARIRQRNKILSEGAKGYPSSPVRGGVNMPGSPIFKETPFLERRFGRRGAAAISEGLIGGAFPLLFGQGAGAAALGGIGGAAGGFAGGGLGFGLSLIGTALGTAFDQLNQAAQETGKALKYPVEAFDQLRDAGLLASRQQEYYISKLIEAGRLTEAAGEIQAEIIKKIGVQGTRDLQQLGDSSSRLSKAWAEFNLQLQAAIAGPMADLLDWVSGIVGEINRANRSTAALRDFMQALSPEQQQEYLRRSIELRNQNNGVVDPAALRRLQQEMLPGGVQAPASQLTPEQLEQQKQAQAVTQELQAQVELQSKQLSLTGLTLERDGARYVNAAKAVALQEYDNKLLEIKNSWIGKIFDKEQNLAQIRIANLEYAAQLRQINEEIARRQEELYQNSLQAEMALYQQRQKSIELIVRYAEFNSGEEAGLREQLSLANNMRQQKLAEFYVEEELALIAAQKNGTYEQTATLYAERLLALEKELALEEAIAAQRIVQLQFNKALAIEDAKRQATDPFTQFRESQQLDEQFARNYFRLLQEGIAPAEAERLANFERLVSEQLRSLDVQIAIAQSTYDEAINRGLVGDALKTYADNLERLQRARDAAREEAARGAGPAPQELPGMKIQEFISTAEEELKDLESVAISISERIGDAVGSSISSGISGLIEGTKTAQEVFADFLKNIGEILVSEAAKMIATYVAIGLARQFAGLFGGGPSGGAGGAGASDLPTAITSTLPIAANGAYFDNGIAAFAKGGMFTNSVVSSPTLFQFADGGVTRTGVMGEAGPEAIMPLKRGADGKLGVAAQLNGAMQRYRATPGSATAAAEAGATAGGGAAAATMEPIDVRYSVERINNVDYVTADQFQQGMAQAAEQGARRGEQRALYSLRQNTNTRQRIGL